MPARAPRGCHRCSRLNCTVHRVPKQRLSSSARGLGAEHQAVARRVLERDGWICQLCMKPIDRSAPPRSRWAQSVDHIVPRSRGGHAGASNLRAAHYGCNSARGNRPNRQLARSDTNMIEPRITWT